MVETTYLSPVDALLTYGRAKPEGWPDYLQLGLTREHIPDLIRMATDPELNWADSDSLEVWAPNHAWRALGQLQAEEAIDPLIGLFHGLEDSEWVMEELPEVFGMIGPQAIPALARYLADPSHDLWPRVIASASLEKIGNAHAGAREECIAVLTRQLERFEEQDPTLNGFLISDLVDLKAVEALPLIHKAYEADCVDYFILGDIEDVEVELGLRKERSSEPSYPDPLEHLSAGRKLALAAPQTIGKKQKVGRNAPCPCGSGKKYKKCCLNR